MLPTASSDALLRPDVSLLLPFLTANNPHLLLLSSALLPLKWASGCDCFTGLCVRKRQSRVQALAILVCLVVARFLHATVPFGIALLSAVITPESNDTKALKFLLILLGRFPLVGAPVGILLFLGYLYACGYQVRLSDSYELFLSNDTWLVTKDGRLAKRVNHHGEFHAEVIDEGKARLVGDGRLVGVGAEMKTLSMDDLDGLNREVVQLAHQSGRVKISNGSAVIGS